MHGAGKVTRAWLLAVSFLQTRHSGCACAGRTVRQCCVEPTFTSDARLVLASMTSLLACVNKQRGVVGAARGSAMSSAGVASRPAPDSTPLPTVLPVRLYMRALRQYQKLLDLRRLTSKDKVSFQNHY